MYLHCFWQSQFQWIVIMGWVRKCYITFSNSCSQEISNLEYFVCTDIFLQTLWDLRNCLLRQGLIQRSYLCHCQYSTLIGCATRSCVLIGRQRMPSLSSCCEFEVYSWKMCSSWGKWHRKFNGKLLPIAHKIMLAIQIILWLKCLDLTALCLGCIIMATVHINQSKAMMLCAVASSWSIF